MGTRKKADETASPASKAKTDGNEAVHDWRPQTEGFACSKCNVVAGSFASTQPCPGKEWCEAES